MTAKHIASARVGRGRDRGFAAIVALVAAGLIGAALPIVAPAFAQDAAASDGFDQKAYDKRLDRIEKNLREVRAIVLQAKDTGHPVEVRTASSDDQINAIQTRLDDIDQTVRGLTGQIEVLSHDLDLVRKNAAATQTQTADLATRLDKLEKQVAVLAAPPPAPAASAQAAPDQNAAPAGSPANAADAGAAYTQARQLMLSGDYGSAADAFQKFIDAYPESPSAPAAHYWLGEIKFSLGDYQAAAANLFSAIRGWPKTPWAPEAMTKLALSLVQINKSADACATLHEFDRHYPKAAAGAKARAAAARVKAACAR